jgi:hypothetical protein
LATFEHSGAGGQQAFADPRNDITYGYTRLIRALYAAANKVR